MAKKEKLKSYSQVISEAYKRCAGKSRPHFGDIKEFAGHLGDVIEEDENAKLLFLKNARRRVRRKSK